MKTKSPLLKALIWSATQRLQFIEFRLFWEGHVNRSDLIETFGISVPQSTLDFREYMQRAPGNMDYDKRERQYFKTPTFKPIFISSHAEGYLSQLNALAIDRMSQSVPGLIGATPSFDVLPSPERRVDTDTLQALLKCIRDKHSVEIHYQSLSSPDPTWRRVSPHSLASDGLRWHIRAYCHSKLEFRDFVLGRIMDIRDTRPDLALTENSDVDWNEFINVTIAPNPALTVEQHKIIERDFSMKEGTSQIRIRRSLLFYLKRRLGLDNDMEKTPAAQQVIIVKTEPVL